MVLRDLVTGFGAALIRYIRVASMGPVLRAEHANRRSDAGFIVGWSMLSHNGNIALYRDKDKLLGCRILANRGKLRFDGKRAV
jgi:hypothetical protein